MSTVLHCGVYLVVLFEDQLPLQFGSSARVLQQLNVLQLLGAPLEVLEGRLQVPQVLVLPKVRGKEHLDVVPG